MEHDQVPLASNFLVFLLVFYYLFMFLIISLLEYKNKPQYVLKNKYSLKPYQNKTFSCTLIFSV